MIKLTETREIAPYLRVHPDEDRQRVGVGASALIVSSLRFA
jgi:hypothetical protein